MRRAANADGENSLSHEIEPLKEVPVGEPSGAATAERTSIPVGHWRDGLWDLFRHGSLHSSVWISCCCVPIAAGQVISRLKLNMWGRHITTSSSAAFRKLVILAVSFWIIRVTFLLIIALLDPNIEQEGGEWIEPGWAYHILVFVDNILAYIYMGFTAILLCRLRSQVRSKFAIPQGDQCPAGFEDCCCSLFCPCFVAAQMMRHTTDYNTYSGRCCTETGLPGNVPSIV